MKEYYEAYDIKDGACGHKHRTVGGAHRCARGGHNTQRTIHINKNGRRIPLKAHETRPGITFFLLANVEDVRYF